MLLRIDHETKLTYTDTVIESVMEVKMSPPSTEDQTVLGYKLRITPTSPLTAYRDGFSNRTELFNVLTPHSEIIIRASSCVRVHRRSLDRLQGVSLPLDQTALGLEGLEFVRPSPLTQPTPELQAFVDSLPKPSGSLKESIEQLVKAVRGRLKYEKKVTNSNTPVGEALKLGQGVCQDFSHLFLASARMLGIPARYVSGYVNQPGEIATHAWCQIWAGSAVGWVDVDPTQGKWVENQHVITALGRDYGDVPPNRGVWKGGTVEEAIAVAVSVKVVDQVPTDLTELTVPVWTQTMVSQGMMQQNRNGFHQQSRRQSYRQQQSQQQQ
jgi:transglutaminase-like putative cysteine protease